MSELIDPKRLANRAGYRFWVEERVRQVDTDMQGHVNNTVFPVYFEIARSSMRELLALRPAGTFGIVARQVIHYHAELNFPSTIRIGAGIARIGSKSYVMGYGLWCGDDCVATGEVTQVMFDGTAKKSIPIPEPFRTALTDYLLP